MHHVSLRSISAFSRARRLAKVEINAADVKIIQAETDWSAERSERVLRENGGNVVATLRSYTKP